MKGEIVEFELAEDVQNFITFNSDVEFKEPDLKEQIKKAEKSDLLKIVKTISSPTTIISVQVVDENFAKTEL